MNPAVPRLPLPHGPCPYPQARPRDAPDGSYTLSAFPNPSPPVSPRALLLCSLLLPTLLAISDLPRALPAHGTKERKSCLPNNARHLSLARMSYQLAQSRLCSPSSSLLRSQPTPRLSCFTPATGQSMLVHTFWDSPLMGPPHSFSMSGKLGASAQAAPPLRCGALLPWGSRSTRPGFHHCPPPYGVDSCTYISSTRFVPGTNVKGEMPTCSGANLSPTVSSLEKVQPEMRDRSTSLLQQ